VRSLGAKGDNAADDTAAVQKAIDAHRVVYFPTGFYRVTDTLKLRPDTVLIGLHPSLTQIVLPDHTPGYQGVGAPKALVESAAKGDAIVSGLGLNTGGINPRATALLWTSGANSLVDDVKFQGGHGTNLYDGTRVVPYNANATADADPAKRWAGQYPSLWVTNGGGGTFANIWSPSTYAYSGIYVSDTQTPGHVYQASVEHHLCAPRSASTGSPTGSFWRRRPRRRPERARTPSRWRSATPATSWWPTITAIASPGRGARRRRRSRSTTRATSASATWR
jgi:hypothetical protein